jgi:hypothetical protein
MAAMRAVPATAGLSDLKNCMLGCLFPYPAGCRECGPVAASEQKEGAKTTTSTTTTENGSKEMEKKKAQQ